MPTSSTNASLSSAALYIRRESLALVLVGILLGGPVTPAPAQPHPEAEIPESLATRVTAADQFLLVEMDRWAWGTVIFDEYQSGAAGFYPSNWFGDVEDLHVDERCTQDPKVGSTCFKVTYAPRGPKSAAGRSAGGAGETYAPRGPKGFAGIVWAYPDLNWGEVRGRDLTGATRLQGWIRCAQGAETVKLEVARINLPDGSHRTIPRSISVGPTWTPFTIPLPRGMDLRNVSGGFTLALKRSARSPRPVVIFLDAVCFDNADPDGLRLIRSYVPTAGPGDDAIRNGAYLYDNALAILALLSRRDAKGDRRARILADAFVRAQEHDRHYRDGRWRNAYAVGPLIDPASGTARLPGLYDPNKKTTIEDLYAVSSDCGNTAWAGLALLAAHRRLEVDKPGPGGKAPSYPYLQAALKAATWIVTECRVIGKKYGGFSGGFEGWEPTREKPEGPKKLPWRSTEHNIDVYVFFEQLAAAIADARQANPGTRGDLDPAYWDPAYWHAWARHALGFVLAMYVPEQRCFRIGVRDEAGTINLDMTASDAQTWSLLALGHLPEFRKRIDWAGRPAKPVTLSWVERNCQATAGGRTGYLFSDRGTGIWPEGSGHLAAAYNLLGGLENRARAISILEEIAPLARQGALPAAYPDKAETGMYKLFVEKGKPQMWTYPARPHLGATAWFLLAARGANPYWLEGPPTSP